MDLSKEVIQSEIAVPEWWCSDADQINDEFARSVKRGKVSNLAISPGNRPIQQVCYGDPEPDCKGTANLNSAVGSGNKNAYVDRTARNRPVMVVLAGIHGHEVEGIVSAMSLIRIMETGADLLGQDQVELADKLNQLRLVIVPLCNPDGRARVPYRGWVGLPQDEMTRWGQGTRKNGELYRWQPSKAVHPMVGDVGLLGAYFDDHGINMMHDDWADPMSMTTKAVLQLVATEGPDCLINLHSYSFAPGILATAYTSLEHEQRLHSFCEKYYARLSNLGLRHNTFPHRMFGPLADPKRRSPSFNLQSMLYHVGTDFSILYESPHGVTSASADFGYKEILEVHHQLFDLAADEVLSAKQA